jgi:transcriptional regulator with XRE-family HTH domain
MKVELVIFPDNVKVLNQLGENIKLCRLRRDLSTDSVSERAGISRKTLYNIEQGNPGVSIGNYIQVLFVLGMHKDFLQVASNDILGRKLQDAGILVKKRASKK